MASLSLPSRKARAAVRRLTRRRAANFRYAFYRLPAEQRVAMEAIYAFARRADDAVDDAGTRVEKTARLEAIPRASDLKDGELDTVLNGNDGRQLLHVTFGSVLTTKSDGGDYLFRQAIRDCLVDNEQEHYAVLKQHLGRHVAPFAR